MSNRTRSFRVSSLLLLLLAAMPPLGHAADPVVYSQPYNTAEDTTWDSYNAPGVASATVYDNFVLSSASNVTAVQWQGTYIDHDNLANNPTAPNATSFVVSFYADNSGQPGAQLATAAIPVTSCAETSLGTVGFNTFNDPTTYQIAFYSYRAALPTAFTASAGQTYWLSVVGNNSTATPIWSWYASTADGDTTCFQDFQGNRITRSGDRAFALEGTAATVTAPAVTVSATSDADAATGEKGVFVFSLSAATGSDLTVTYKLKGSATAGVDYKALPGSVTITAGATSAKVKVKPKVDPDGGGTTVVKLILQAGTGYIVGTPGPVKVKIKQ